MKKSALILLLIISIVANIFLGLLYLDSIKSESDEKEKPSNTSNIDGDSSKYPLLSKRIFIEKQNDIIINFIPLREAIREYVKEQDDKIGVYFEYLPSGTSIGINDRLEVQLASLIKIPIAMGVYREIEHGKLKKNDKLILKKEHLDRRFGTIWQQGENSTITVEEALNYMIIDSDNTSSNMLRSIISDKAINHVFDSLDVPKDVDGEYHVISPKSYSSIMRSLYLSSYLRKESSHEILDILTKTKFNDKIAAGVPTGIKVAHKIGVFDLKGSPDKAYSDCGIIYEPNRPYLLCIVTKSNEQDAKKHMKNISSLIYSYITTVKGGN